MVFDEPSYIAIARGLLSGNLAPLQIDSPIGRQHPPLGTCLIAAGMKLAGDSPVGWRLASVTAGTITVVGIFLWVYVLIQDFWLALTAAALTLFNNFLYVMARVAMLDAFMFAFAICGLLAFTAAVKSDLAVKWRRVLVMCSGVGFGLGGACKWNTVDIFVVVIAAALALYGLGNSSSTKLNHQLRVPAQNARVIGLPALLIGLVVVPALVYLSAFLPLFGVTHTAFSLRELVRIHAVMFRMTKSFSGNPALYSAWYTWPFRISPVRGFSYLMGNWVVMWGGLVALAVVLWRLRRELDLAGLMLPLLYLANLLQWAVTPLKVPHYYYYYSAAMFLGPANRGEPDWVSQNIWSAGEPACGRCCGCIFCLLLSADGVFAGTVGLHVWMLGLAAPAGRRPYYGPRASWRHKKPAAAAAGLENPGFGKSR